MQSLQYFPRLLAEFHSVNEVGLILYLFSHESLCKPAALKEGIRNPESGIRKRKRNHGITETETEMETETEYGIKYQ